VPGAILTLAALIISGISSVLHLGHPERIFGALGHPASGIFLEALFMGLFGLLILFYLISIQRNASDASRKILATLGVVPAVLLAFAVGYTYVMPSRPAWNTMILPLLYMASAAVMGCFSAALLLSRTKDTDATDSLSKTAIAFLGIQAVLTVAYIGHLALAPYADATRSATRVLGGDLAPWFWAGLVFVGLLAPMSIMLRAKKTGTISLASTGLFCVLIAGVAFRAIMFSLGSAVRHFF
jgi:anaerobic dimethyl sulfoxide reductase subunit C (anchor subunit)